MRLQKNVTGQECSIMTTLRTTAGVAVLLMGILLCPTAHAVDVDAGDYTALPAGTNLGLLYYQNATRKELYASGSKVPINPRLDSDVGILRGVHYMDIGGYIVDPQFLLPFGSLKAKNDISALGSGNGIGDLILAATVWFNKPTSDTHFGITPFLFLPTGDYDKNKALNLGENRWKFTLQAGYITNLSEKVTLDLVGDVTIFGKNDEYGPTSATMKQDPSYQFQGHLRYKLQPTWDLRASLSHTTGGETKVNGVASNDKTKTTKFTIGTAWFAAPTLQLMANYGRDASVENGFKEENRLNLRVLKIF